MTKEAYTLQHLVYTIALANLKKDILSDIKEKENISEIDKLTVFARFDFPCQRGAQRTIPCGNEKEPLYSADMNSDTEDSIEIPAIAKQMMGYAMGDKNYVKPDDMNIITGEYRGKPIYRIAPKNTHDYCPYRRFCDAGDGRCFYE